MIEVYQRFFIGDDSDATNILLRNEPNWAILHCCKEPWHREMLGYTGRAAPNNHPEYLFALRGSRLALNMVDTSDPKYFSTEMVGAGLAFMNYMYKMGYNVLCHCNEGQSRGPMMGMLFMASKLKELPERFEEAEAEFMRIYPYYYPRQGIWWHIADNWEEYLNHNDHTGEVIDKTRVCYDSLWAILKNG